MASLTLVVLIAFLFLSFFFYKKDVIAPGFLLVLAFTGSYLIVLLNRDTWEIVIYPEFIICLSTVIVSWHFGGGVVRFATSNLGIKRTTHHNSSVRYKAEYNYPYGLMIIISVFFVMLYVAQNLGSFSISNIMSFKDALSNRYHADDERNVFKTQIIEIITAVGFMSIYRLMMDRYVLKKKGTTLKLLIPIVLYMFCSLISTDRNTLLRLVIFFLCMYVFFLRARYNFKDINRIIFVRVAIIALGAMMLFWLFGLAKNYKSDLNRSVGIYGGSGLYNFNLWVHNYNKEHTMGSDTFSVFKTTLKAFGIGNGSDFPRHLEFVIFRSHTGYVYATNIYSAMRPYYNDFGMFGLVLFPMLIGMFYEFVYIMTLRHRYGYSWLFYSSMLYPVIYFPIAEQMIKRFHLGLVYENMWLLFFFIIIYCYDGLWRVKVVE